MLIFQSLLTLKFVKVLSDIEISGDREGRDEFLFVSLYASACVGFLTVEPVMRENRCGYKNRVCSQMDQRIFQLTH